MSLADLNGSVEVTERIKNPVQIDFDQWGIPFIHGKSREDVAYAMGYLHGSERFFQMDLSRRFAAGELAELVGESVLYLDKRSAVHQFRARAKEMLPNLQDEKLKQLSLYAKGVNDGLSALKTKPFEYFALMQKPEPWTTEDSLLVAYTFYMSMQDDSVVLDRTRQALQETLPEDIAEFFIHNGNAWEASLDGSKLPILDIPPIESWSFLNDAADVTEKTESSMTWTEIGLDDSKVGSNNWAVSTNRSENGKVMIANDPHLYSEVPGVWYKVSYDYQENETNETIEVHGFSLPGLPVAVIGQSKWTAWGLTVAYIDTADLVRLQVDPKNSNAYITNTGTSPLEIIDVPIKVKKKPPVIEKIKVSPFGPVIDTLPNGDMLALHWVAHQKNALNLDVFDLEKARGIKEILDTSARSKLSVMNFVAGDVSGNIGWTYFGFVPDQEIAKETFVEKNEQDSTWAKSRDPMTMPRVVNPEKGVIWTANNRVLGGEELNRSGTGSVEQGARAFQIEEKLSQSAQLSMNDMQRIQHDTECQFMLRWRDLMLEFFEETDSEEFEEFETIIRSWDGFASKDSISYNLIMLYREIWVQYLAQQLFESCRKQDNKIDITRLHYEEPFYQLASKRPDYIPIRHKGKRSTLEDFNQSIMSAMNTLSVKKSPPRWGESNKVEIKHPLSRSVPFLKQWLDMPVVESDGDSYCPKVISGGSHVSSFRMVSIPGEPENSYYQMICGQSGHPMSKHYKDLHMNWLGKEYLPMKPGQMTNQLILKPKSE